MIEDTIRDLIREVFADEVKATVREIAAVEVERIVGGLAAEEYKVQALGILNDTVTAFIRRVAIEATEELLSLATERMREAGKMLDETHRAISEITSP